tara:strand:+ start:5350 stop:5673 length:324 start_codon:yes stop_codon:yes gene_type:complete
MISSLKSREKIELLFEKGTLIKEDGLFLKIYNFKDNEIKFGVAVSKKLFPSAVKRNLIKRRVREQVRSSGFLKNFLKGSSFFIIYGSENILSSKEIKKKLLALALKI